MKTRTNLTILVGAALTLAACGSSDDASVEATADTVEMPADEALEAISEDAAEDPEATEADAPEGDAASAEEAANAAADVAAEAVVVAESASE
jgi:hypothetical protein